jgi:dTDP-D-glucose 4,6-dehydratase
MLENPGPVTSTEYNVGPDLETRLSVSGLIALFSENDLTIEHLAQAGTDHEAPSLLINSNKIKGAIGWEPRLETTRAVQLTAEWYLAVVGGKMGAHEETRRQILEYLSVD